jgi:hypothetical protein
MPMQLLVHDLAGSLLQRFEQDGIGDEFFLIDQNDSLRATTPPFRGRPFAAAGPNGIALASTNSRDVLTVSTEGMVRRVLQLPRDDSPPGARLVDSVRAAWAEAPTAEANRVLRRRAIAEMPSPTARPVVGDLRFDQTGRLWVAAADVDGTPGTRWDVYAEDAHLGFVELPEAIALKELGANHLLAVETDAMGVESVLRVTFTVLQPE